MSGPYFTTFINTETCVPPNQLNSDIITNIKQNLIKKHKGKCFNRYGYIMDIYSIDSNIGDGMMRPEDNSASVYYNVQFKAKLCNPMKFNLIVARIEDINRHMIYAKNGPNIIIVDGQNINGDKFKYNNSKNALFPLNNEGKEIAKAVNSGTYIVVKILNKRMTNGDNKIMVLGSLEGLASDDEIKTSIRDENSNNDNITVLEDILNADNVKNIEEDIEDSESTIADQNQPDQVHESAEVSDVELSVESDTE